MERTGLLALEDGALFWGESVGHEGLRVGEIVFHTSMTGYQETLTDPSYAGQILCFTFPHIGIVGVNEEDSESKRIWAQGVIMRSFSKETSSWRATGDLQSLFQKEGVVALSGVDTRKLTHILRSKGPQRACIMAGRIDPRLALHSARSEAISPKVPLQQAIEGTDGSLFHVAVLDFGCKRSILQKLTALSCRITLLRGEGTAEEVMQLHPDGVLISNGPGDPSSYRGAIEAIKFLLDQGMPLFGICLGHQLLGLASGARVFKMKQGHHGANHPILEVPTGKISISSQNHNYAIEERTLPRCLEVTHRSLFDGSIAGIRHKDRPAFGFQGHPEGGPGPHELGFLFAEFLTLIKENIPCPKKPIFTRSS